MFHYVGLWLGLLTRCLRSPRSLLLENLALRQQLAVLKRKHPRPRRGGVDKIFWVFARRFWGTGKAVPRAGPRAPGLLCGAPQGLKPGSTGEESSKYLNAKVGVRRQGVRSMM